MRWKLLGSQGNSFYGTPCTASDNGACLVRDMAYPSTHHGTAHMFITPTLASDRLQLTITYIDPAYNSKQQEH